MSTAVSATVSTTPTTNTNMPIYHLVMEYPLSTYRISPSPFPHSTPKACPLSLLSSISKPA